MEEPGDGNKVGQMLGDVLGVSQQGREWWWEQKKDTLKVGLTLLETVLMWRAKVQALNGDLSFGAHETQVTMDCCVTDWGIKTAPALRPGFPSALLMCATWGWKFPFHLWLVNGRPWVTSGTFQTTETQCHNGGGCGLVGGSPGFAPTHSSPEPPTLSALYWGHI